MSTEPRVLTAADLSAVSGGKGGSLAAQGSTTKKVTPKVTAAKPEEPQKPSKGPMETFIERGNQFIGEGMKLLAAPLAGPSLLCPQCPAILGNAKVMSGEGTA
ncbi:MAG: hypothetical protein AB7O24_31335 [Kofleriaceae bacterium]